MRLAAEIYRALNACRDYGLRDQMQRAAVSIPSNIAEGYERNTNKDFVHFLYIAKGSCSELRTQIYLAVEIGAFDKASGRTEAIASLGGGELDNEECYLLSKMDRALGLVYLEHCARI